MLSILILSVSFVFAQEGQLRLDHSGALQAGDVYPGTLTLSGSMPRLEGATLFMKQDAALHVQRMHSGGSYDVLFVPMSAKIPESIEVSTGQTKLKLYLGPRKVTPLKVDPKQPYFILVGPKGNGMPWWLHVLVIALSIGGIFWARGRKAGITKKSMPKDYDELLAFYDTHRFQIRSSDNAALQEFVRTLDQLRFRPDLSDEDKEKIFSSFERGLSEVSSWN